MNYSQRTFAKANFKMSWLHSYLARADQRWNDVPPHEVKTSPPRELVSRMLQHINGLKKDKKKLLKLLEEVPPLPENTAELESEASKSKTLSEKYDSDEGEQKDGSSYTLPL